MFHFSHARVLYLVKEGKLKKENNPAQKKKKTNTKRPHSKIILSFLLSLLKQR